MESVCPNLRAPKAQALLNGLLIGILAGPACGLNYKSKLSAPKPVPSVSEFVVQDWLKFAPATENSSRFGEIRVNWTKLTQDGETVSPQAGDSLYLGATPRSEVTAGFDPTVSPPTIWRAAVLTAASINPNYPVATTVTQRSFSGTLAEGKEYVLSAAIKRGNAWIVNAPKVGVFIYDSRSVTASATSTAAGADLKDAQATQALGSPLRSPELKVSGRCLFKRGASGASSIHGDVAYVTLAGIKVSGDYSFENATPIDSATGVYEGTVTVDTNTFPELASSAGNELRWVCKAANGLSSSVVLRKGIDFTAPRVLYVNGVADGLKPEPMLIKRGKGSTLPLKCGCEGSTVQVMSVELVDSIGFPREFLTVPVSTPCPVSPPPCTGTIALPITIGCTPTNPPVSPPTDAYKINFEAVDSVGNRQSMKPLLIKIGGGDCMGLPGL